MKTDKVQFQKIRYGELFIRCGHPYIKVKHGYSAANLKNGNLIFLNRRDLVTKVIITKI